MSTLGGVDTILSQEEKKLFIPPCCRTQSTRERLSSRGGRRWGGRRAGIPPDAERRCRPPMRALSRQGGNGYDAQVFIQKVKERVYLNI